MSLPQFRQGLLGINPPARRHPLFSMSVVQCPGCQRVSFSAQARWRAARALVRPSEVAHLFTRVPTHWLPNGYTVAGNIANWFQNSFATGSLKYFPDPPGIDMWCSPCMTLFFGGGDCDDLAILAASMLEYAGAAPQVAIGYYCKETSCDGHAWVEGRDSQGWFLLEATNGQLYRYFRPAQYVLKQLVQPKPMQ